MDSRFLLRILNKTSIIVLIVLAALVAVGCGQGESGGAASSGSASGGSASGGSASGGASVSPEGFTPGEDSLVVYSGRSEELVGPIIERFEEESGIDVEVRYGETAELAATILEEGRNSPADIFFSQDAGALGAVADRGRLQELPEDALRRVEERFRDPDGRWIGISGRA